MSELREKHTDMVRALMQRMDNSEDHLLHGAVGIIGEVVELTQETSRAKLIREFGDIEFYLTTITLWLLDYAPSEVLSRETGQPVAMPFTEAYTHLIQSSANLLDLAKKHWAYGQVPYYSSIHEARTQIRYALDNLYETFGLSRTLVLNENIIKLSARYPEFKFTTEAAAQRKDEH